jgi:hypothetical protein
MSGKGGLVDLVLHIVWILGCGLLFGGHLKYNLAPARQTNLCLPAVCAECELCVTCAHSPFAVAAVTSAVLLLQMQGCVKTRTRCGLWLV